MRLPASVRETWRFRPMQPESHQFCLYPHRRFHNVPARCGWADNLKPPGKGSSSTLPFGLIDIWFYFAAALEMGLAIAASGHALLYKRDVRATIAWVGMIWLVPFVGAGLYVWLGINRIERRARSRRARRPDSNDDLKTRTRNLASSRPMPLEPNMRICCRS